MLDIFAKESIKDVYVHVISDGRDTDIHSLYSYISMLEEKMNTLHVGKIASICGRYYAMDRDKNFERTKKYYDLIVNGEGILAENIPKAIQTCYTKDITDEFIPPLKTTSYQKIEETILYYGPIIVLIELNKL